MVLFSVVCVCVAWLVDWLVGWLLCGSAGCLVVCSDVDARRKHILPHLTTAPDVVNKSGCFFQDASKFQMKGPEGKHASVYMQLAPPVERLK